MTATGLSILKLQKNFCLTYITYLRFVTVKLMSDTEAFITTLIRFCDWSVLMNFAGLICAGGSSMNCYICTAGEADFSCLHELQGAFYAVHNLAGSVTYVVHMEAVLLLKKSGAVLQLFLSLWEKKEGLTVPWKGLYIGKLSCFQPIDYEF